MSGLSPAAILYDESGTHPVGVVLDGVVYRLQASAKIARASDGAYVNPATQETLAAIKDTDGVKKIVDALPAGDNNIGNVDAIQSGTWTVQQGTPPWAVKGTDADGAAPTQNPVLAAGWDGEYVRRIATLQDGTVKVTQSGRTKDMVTGKLLNGTAYNMNVNGSVTPVNFTYPAPVGYNLLLSQLRFVFVPNVLRVDDTSFGAFGALTNGVRIAVTENGTEYVIGLLQRSEDLFSFSCGVDPLIEVSLTANDMVVFGVNFGEGMKLYAGTSDKVEVRIQDNISSPQGANYLRHFSATLIGVKETI